MAAVILLSLNGLHVSAHGFRRSDRLNPTVAEVRRFLAAGICLGPPPLHSCPSGHVLNLPTLRFERLADVERDAGLVDGQAEKTGRPRHRHVNIPHLELLQRA